MPRRATTHLTDRVIRALLTPASDSTITYDSDVAGFGIRVTAKDARSFVLNYVVHGRERRLTIGRFPTWSATAARDEAKALRRKIDAGIDPLEEEAAERQAAEAARAAPTVQDLFARYEAEHLPRKAVRAAADDRSMWQKIVLPHLGSMKVAGVSPADIDALHAAVSVTRPTRANRVVEVMRKAFNLAIRWGWRADNPAAGVHRNHEERRARYLSPVELLKLSEALSSHAKDASDLTGSGPEQAPTNGKKARESRRRELRMMSVNAIRLLMLTGARRSEVLGARWDMFDLEAGVWVKPSAHTKQRTEHRVPLSALAIELLKEMRSGASGPYVFPGTGGKPLTDVKRTWLTVCRKAGLATREPKKTRSGKTIFGKDGKRLLTWRTTARLHDLRHTYASILASEGLSLPIIGALLGHTQPQTTARYAHLLDDPLRAATEKVGAIVSGNATSADPASA
jgi:integrase